MKAEILLIVFTPLVSVGLAFHCFLRRGKQITLLYLLMGVGFGIFFPVTHVSIFHSYSFHFRYKFFGLPPFLPLFWWCAFYISFCLSESIAISLTTRETNRVIPFLAGLVMSIMEIIWDDWAVRKGMLSFQKLSHLWYRPDFHNGIAPQINVAHFIFAYVYAYTIARLELLSEGVPTRDTLYLPRLLLSGLLMMLSLLPIGLYFWLLRFAVLDAWLSPIAALIMDVSVSLTVAIIYILQTRWLFFIMSCALCSAMLNFRLPCARQY